jgi:hypothetical protein
MRRASPSSVGSRGKKDTAISSPRVSLCWIASQKPKFWSSAPANYLASCARWRKNSALLMLFSSLASAAMCPRSC